MQLRRIILGALLFQCTLYAQSTTECPIFSDPNDYYIDDPNTLDNGLFDCNDPSYDLYDTFTPPRNWKRVPYEENTLEPADCYVSLHSSFAPEPEPRHPEPEKVTWSISRPFEGNRFVVLSTGDMGPGSDDKIKGSMASQEIFLSEGDSIVGAYYFGTCDYPTFDDAARIFCELDTTRCPNSIDCNEIVSEFEIVSISVNDPDIGSYGSTDDWIPFSHTVGP
ncbi:MAG: hypothetical protein ACYSU8_02250, partial [Planctomycetota bacterium]